MKYTIITVAYNEEHGIAETMNSVIGQDYEDIEYIIIDGNSSDGTVKIAEKIAGESDRDVKIFSEDDFGIYNAMNRGIVRASGDYIMFMNAGDSFYDGAVLSNIAKQIKEHGNAIYYGQACLIKNGKCKGINKNLSEHGCLRYNTLMKGYMPIHQSIAAPLYILKKHGFNEEYKIRADYDWLLRCCKDGLRLVNLNFVVCKYDNSGISARAKYKKIMNKETQTIRKRNFPILGRIYGMIDMAHQ